MTEELRTISYLGIPSNTPGGSSVAARIETDDTQVISATIINTGHGFGIVGDPGTVIVMFPGMNSVYVYTDEAGAEQSIGEFVTYAVKIREKGSLPAPDNAIGEIESSLDAEFQNHVPEMRRIYSGR